MTMLGCVQLYYIVGNAGIDIRMNKFYTMF